MIWRARDQGEGAVRGERAAALAAAARSMQSRTSSVLAAALVIAVGVAALSWYYAHALTRGSRTRQAAQSAAVGRAQGEMPLPPLGRIEPPAPPAGAAPRAAATSAAPQAAPDLPLGEARLPDGHVMAAAFGDAATSLPPTPVKTHRELALERRLTGVVFAWAQTPAAATSDSDHAGEAVAQPLTQTDARRATDGGEGSMAALLRPNSTPVAQASLLPDTRFLLPKGSFIDCTLETAIDSTLPGMTTCITATDSFGADGKVVLFERGTKLVGETHGQVQQGQARVFVLWTQARTPAGVVVPLDSPGTDELGRAGLPGQVQRHFWQRFGAAMLVSLVDGAVQAGVQSSNRSGGTVIYTPAGSQDVLTEVLKDSLHIAPTVVKNNGDRIQVLVARDLDFRPVYELRTAAPGR